MEIKTQNETQYETQSLCDDLPHYILLVVILIVMIFIFSFN